MGKKKKNKNSHQNKSNAPKKNTAAVQQENVSDERYVAKRKRDRDKNDTVHNDAAEVLTAEKPEEQIKPQTEQTPEVTDSAGEDFGTIFAVSTAEQEQSAPKRRRPSRFEKKHARKKAADEAVHKRAEKKSARKKEVPAAVKLSDMAREYDKREDMSYRESLKKYAKRTRYFFTEYQLSAR